VPDFDLFISYRRKDVERVLPLVAALRAEGLSVWLDQSEIGEFVPITDKIRHGLAESRALLAWYSEAYPQSRPCQMDRYRIAMVFAQGWHRPRRTKRADGVHSRASARGAASDSRARPATQYATLLLTTGAPITYVGLSGGTQRRGHHAAGVRAFDPGGITTRGGSPRCNPSGRNPVQPSTVADTGIVARAVNLPRKSGERNVRQLEPR
jgi:TIR domain